MARNNYSFKKRQKELKRQKKREEKLQSRLAKKADEASGEASVDSDTEADLAVGVLEDKALDAESNGDAGPGGAGREPDGD